jgi:origin recognition complex subunit 5
MSQAPNSPGLHFAHVNAVTCFTSRLFYDSVLNALADWHPTWEDGCENWSAGGSEQRVNDGLDGFLHGLRAIATASTPMLGATRKGKEKAVENAERDTRLIVAVDKPERLKESLPDLFIPLTKLNDLVSATQWS